MSLENINLSIICGGQSAEHSISIRSAKNVAHHALSITPNVSIVYITMQGEWKKLSSTQDFIVSEGLSGDNLLGETLQLTPGKSSPWCIADNGIACIVDAVFPLVHGTTGEDGCLQGLLQILDLPYVGANVLGSAIGMHKDVVKQLWKNQGLPTCEWRVITNNPMTHISYDEIVKQLGGNLFVKPASQGSSFGVSHVLDKQSYDKAVALALSYDGCIIVEPEIAGREIECSVQGYGDSLHVSLPGEHIVHGDFYSFDEKYKDSSLSTTQTPAILSDLQQTEIQLLALRACHAVYCEGMARVDFFVTDSGIYLNEINTIPGFTDISLYPANWEAGGVSIVDLIKLQLNSAISMYQENKSVICDVVAQHENKQ